LVCFFFDLHVEGHHDLSTNVFFPLMEFAAYRTFISDPIASTAINCRDIVIWSQGRQETCAIALELNSSNLEQRVRLAIHFPASPDNAHNEHLQPGH
jgi:hypothetical protein